MKYCLPTFILIMVVLIVLSAFSEGIQSDPVSIKIRLAQELERDGYTEPAIRIYEELMAEAPDNLVVFTRLKDLYIQSGDYEKALRLIEDRLSIHPKEMNLEVYAAQVKYRLGYTEEAWAAWYELLNRYAGSASVYQSVASVLIGERLLDEAIDVYSRGRKRIGNDDLFAFNLASLHAARMEYGKAVDELMVYWRAHPKHISVVESQLRRFPKTTRVIREVVDRLEAGIKISPKDAELRQILASVYMRAEMLDEALDVVRDVERLRPAERQGEALFRYGKDAFRSGVPDKAVRAFQEILASYPNFPRGDQVLMETARCFEAMEKYDAAIQHYQEVFERYTDHPAARQALLQKGILHRDELKNIEEAKKDFRYLIGHYGSTKEGMESRLALGRCEVISGELDSADLVYSEIIENDKKRDAFWLQALLGRVDIAYYQGRFDGASDLLKELNRDGIPGETVKNPAFNDGLTRSMLLSEYANTSGDALETLADAELMTIQGKAEKAFYILDSLVTNIADIPLAADALYEQGIIAVSLGLLRKGLACFDYLVSQFPEHILADRALERSGWILEQKGDREEALSRYEILLTDYPHSLTADDIRQRIRKIEEK